MNVLWEMKEKDIQKESINNINDLLNEQIGKDLIVREVIKNKTVSTEMINEYKLNLKKILLGNLESNPNIIQLMIASQFNVIHILSSIEKILISKDKNTLKFLSNFNNDSEIFYEIILRNDKEGENDG